MKNDFRDMSGDYDGGGLAKLLIPLLLLGLSGGSKAVTIAGITIGGDPDEPDPKPDPPDPPVIIIDDFYQWVVPSNKAADYTLRIEMGTLDAGVFPFEVFEGEGDSSADWSTPTRAYSAFSGKAAGSVSGVYPNEPFGREMGIAESSDGMFLFIKSDTLVNDKERVAFILSNIITLGDGDSQTLLWAPNLQEPYTKVGGISTTPKVAVHRNTEYILIKFFDQLSGSGHSFDDLTSDRRYVSLWREWDAYYGSSWSDWSDDSNQVDAALTNVVNTSIGNNEIKRLPGIYFPQYDGYYNGTSYEITLGDDPRYVSVSYLRPGDSGYSSASECKFPKIRYRNGWFYKKTGGGWTLSESVSASLGYKSMTRAAAIALGATDKYIEYFCKPVGEDAEVRVGGYSASSSPRCGGITTTKPSSCTYNPSISRILGTSMLSNTLFPQKTTITLCSVHLATGSEIQTQISHPSGEGILLVFTPITGKTSATSYESVAIVRGSVVVKDTVTPATKTVLIYVPTVSEIGEGYDEDNSSYVGTDDGNVIRLYLDSLGAPSNKALLAVDATSAISEDDLLMLPR